MLPAMGYSDIPYTVTVVPDEVKVYPWSNLLDNLKDGSGIVNEWRDSCFWSKGADPTEHYLRLDFGTSISVKTIYLNNNNRYDIALSVGDDFATRTKCRTQASFSSWV